MMRVAFRVATLLGLLLGGSAMARDSATDAPYPLPAAEQVPGAKPAQKQPRRRAATPAPKPARVAAQPPQQTPAPKQVPLPPRRPLSRQAALEPAAKPVPLPTKPAAVPAPAASPADAEKDLPEGWRVVADPATGVIIGFPTRLFPQSHNAAHGTLWSSPHGEVRLETFRLPQTDLKTLFERMKAEPANRRVEDSKLADDGFVVSGMQGLKDFTVRARRRDGEVRGFTLLYDQAMAGIVAPVAARMASTFAAFPERAAPFALPATPVEYGTGIVASAEGHVVTSARLADGCSVLVVAGQGPAERIAAEQGVALLRVYGARKLAPLAIANVPAADGPLVLLGVPDPREQNGRAGVREVGARLAGSALALNKPAPMAGFAGAAAFDAQGRFAGIMQLGRAQLASIAPATPPLELVGAATIRAALDAHGVSPPETSGDPRAAIVRVICVRK
jgi:hypothetical protein